MARILDTSRRSFADDEIRPSVDELRASSVLAVDLDFVAAEAGGFPPQTPPP